MLKQFKDILFDLLLVYKNFIHWNISKILINVFGFLLGIVLGAPFFIVLWLLMIFDQIDWKEILSSYFSSGGSIGISSMVEMHKNLTVLITERIFLFLGISFFIFGFSYKNLTTINLYFSYLRGEKLEYLKNDYFNFELVFSYFKLLSLVFLILAIPILVFIVSFFVLLYSFGGIESVHNVLKTGPNNEFSIMLGIITLVCLLAFIYLAYRLSFSYFIFLDRDTYPEDKGIYFCIKESLRITSGLSKLFKFLLLMLIFSVIMILLLVLIFSVIIILFDYLGNLLNKSHYAIIFLYHIAIFLVTGGLFEMYLASIYKRIMLDGEIKMANSF